ncbi:diguanylate cyclase domain-containing protein [Sulfurimonas sp.]|uniref:diguanylate cyclase domain-containing protein n=1 Tax=Sulfurimonas sp. TaxID=2022749 RepID=UPI003561D5AE
MQDNINFMLKSKELNNLLNTSKEIIVIDVRTVSEYNNGHIESAVNFPEVFTYLPEGITTDKEKEDFIKFYEILFSKAGVSKNELVVFYEDKFTLKSPRGLTILKYLGYDENNIKVLDGGYLKWVDSGFKTTKKSIQNTQKIFTANIDKELFVDYHEMLSLIDDPSIIKLDVRDKDEWIGISSSPYGIDFAPKKGRIPHSVWIEWYNFITSDMLSVESLHKINNELQKKNIQQNDNIVLYCFKGARLSNSYIALRRLGYQNIRIYFAGWNEWCRKDNAPIINEVENNNNPILQENIALKNKLDQINLKAASLIDFPKYNKEPIFAFDRSGHIVFQNEATKIKLPNIKQISDVFPDISTADIYNIIDNNKTKSTTVKINDKYYLLNFIGSRNVNNILAYGFETTEMNILNKDLKRQNSLIQNIINTVPFRIFWKDKEGYYLGANSLFLEDAQLKNIDDIVGKTDFDMPWANTQAQLFIDDDTNIMNTGRAKLHYEENLTNNLGKNIIISTSKTPLKDESGNIVGVLGSYADVTKQKEMELTLLKQKDILEHRAHHDSLTGLPNRVLFQDRLSQAINKANRRNTKIALFFLDLDHFKEINDSFGHEIGDIVLKTVTKKLTNAIRLEDTVARLGGDEFTIIIENLTCEQDASHSAKKILEELAHPVVIGENTLYISSSIGISIYPDDGLSSKNLLMFSDAAMYKAKEKGRNNFQYHNA